MAVVRPQKGSNATCRPVVSSQRHRERADSSGPLRGAVSAAANLRLLGGPAAVYKVLADTALVLLYDVGGWGIPIEEFRQCATLAFTASRRGQQKLATS